MKLADILLLGLAVAFLIIGVDQTIKLGFSQAYWAFMMAMVLFFAFTLRKARRPLKSGPTKDRRKGRLK